MKKTKVCFQFFIIFLMIFSTLTGCSSREGVAPPTYSISGNIEGGLTSGITVNLTGAATSSAITDTDGNFTFTGLSAGTYTVTPSLTDYTFEPANAVAVITSADITNINFTASLTDSDPGPVGSYSISGNVSGDVAQNATVTLTGTASKTTTTNSDGNYNFTGLFDGSYKVVASDTNCAFEPALSSLTISGANVTNINFTSTRLVTSTYTQFDLAGKWRVQEMLAGVASSLWKRAVININSSGVVTCESYEDSSGVNACPTPLDLVWTMNGEGKVTESGNQASGVTMNMASNKNFITGTVSMRIAQKSAGSFTSSDLNNKSFVFHQLKAGSANEWRRGAGTIGSDGQMTITISMTPTGEDASSERIVGTISEDTSGMVLLTGTDSFKGFLSDDKKTLVATKTDGSDCVLMVFQITGKAYSPGSLPNAVYNSLMMAGGVSPAPLSAYWTSVEFNGTMASSNYWVSNSSYTAGDPVTPIIYADGIVTISEDSSYHGQMSYDEKFIIGTQTLNSGGIPFGYAMIIHALK